MKKYKHFFKTNLFLTLFLSGIFLISCNNSVREYFEYYTDSAAIELMNLENVNGTSPSGFKSIDSNYDGNAEFILRNPKKYTLEMNFFPSEKFSEALDSYYDPDGNWTVTQNASDPNIAQLWINKNLLNYIDNGNLKDSSGNIIKAITGEITIEDSETHRPFESYDVNILVNSPPPVIRNAMFQLTSNSNGTYILCFYLPKVKDTVHECDTKKIKIGSETYYFKDTGSGVNFYTDEECNTAADSNKITTSYTNSLYPLTDDGLTFTAPASDFYPVYFLTGIQFSTNEVKYDIVLEDDFVFASSVGISNKGEKLTAVNIPADTSYFGTDDGYYEIPLTHDGNTITGDSVSGVTIYYTVEQGGSVVASGSGASGVKVKLPSGKKNYTIKAVARKPYFVESDESSKGDISVQRSPVYYVSQSGKSPQKGALGTKASPFRTIHQAVNDITTQANNFGEVTGGYTINLLSNITPDESDTFMNGNHSALVCITNSYKYTINGNGHTIDANKKGRVIYVGGSTSITIENAILTGGNINGHGGAIYFSSHEKLILKNVEIKNNKARYGAGIQLDTACDFISGSIHDNEATSGVAVYIDSNGTLSLGDNSNISSIVNIYNNYNNNEEKGSIGVLGALTINQAKIFDNFIKASVSNPDIPYNVYLPTGKTINVGGDLSGCTIGVTTADSPSSGNTIQITTGYSDSNNLPPSKIFKSDEGYGVLMDEIDNAEAVLAVGGGSIDVPSTSYDDVKISVDKTIFLTKNTGNSLTVTSKVKSGTSYVNIPLNECTYSYELYNHGEKVNGIISTGSAKNIVNFNCASLPDETFELYVYLDYKGKKYQGVFPIEIRGPIGTKSSGETLAVGDIVFNDGTATPYSVIKARPDGKCTDAEKNAAIAVIFRVGDGTEENKTLGVGINQSSGICWCKNCKGVEINFTDTICEPDSGTNRPNWQFNNSSNKDGSKNLEKMINDGADDTGITFNADGTVNFTTSTKSTLTNNYPSFEFAYYYGKNGHNIISGSEYETGWYLPSLSELNDIYRNRTVVNNGLGITGGDKLDTNRYWSSSQSNSNTITACYFNFEDGGCYSIGKAYTGNLNKVRAVRVFN